MCLGRGLHLTLSTYFQDMSRRGVKLGMLLVNTLSAAIVPFFLNI